MRISFGLIFTIILILCSCTSIKDLNYTLEGTSLNLSRKGLTSVPDYVFDNKDLKVLRLYGNEIDTLSERIGELVNLERLFIGRNNLTFLPNSISRLENLEILSVQYNELESLPDSIVYMTNLEQLMLNQNSLTSLPDSIGLMKGLENLELKFNKLDSLPSSIGLMESLKFLDLTQNFLTHLPTSMGNLKYLRELTLVNSGPLLDVPEEMCDLRKLELLNIDGSIAVPPCLLVKQTTILKIVIY